MQIKFSMDKINCIDLVYTRITTSEATLGVECEESYCGDDYCKKIISEIALSSDWLERRYLGSVERFANEAFRLITRAGKTYNVEFSIDTYAMQHARLECTILADDTDDYDDDLEVLKIALKNRLVQDWEVCTWLIDTQAAILCKEAFEKAFIVENNLRAFASKVLIHYLGVDWLNRFGFEKEAESVATLKQKFVQRVPEFDNINADFLSMTLETLVGIILKGKVYKNEIVLNRQNYSDLLSKADKKATAAGLVDYIKARRVVEKDIWRDLFVPFIQDPNDFQKCIHAVIENRNHIAHSKVLSWNAFKIMQADFNEMNRLIEYAEIEFVRKETSDQVLDTLEALHQERVDEEQYYRERIASETGIDVLSEGEIKDWFDETLHDLFSAVYQRYHFDVCFELSDFHTPEEAPICFMMTSLAVEDRSARIEVVAEYSIDDNLGEDSTCEIICKDGQGITICDATVRFHNGNGYEGEEGIMEASEDSEYDTSELEDFKEQLYEFIDHDLNPYFALLEAHTLQNGGECTAVADFGCSQCGKNGVSVDESFLAIGKCCFCGYENEIETCKNCGSLFSSDELENGLCHVCAERIKED